LTLARRVESKSLKVTRRIEKCAGRKSQPGVLQQLKRLLIELTGNTQDPKYRYAWIDSADVDNAAEGANQSRYRYELTEEPTPR
jgi:hypothetical protein